MKRRAVFMDRDGTISEEIGYVNHPSRYRVFPYAAEAVRILNEAGWRFWSRIRREWLAATSRKI